MAPRRRSVQAAVPGSVPRGAHGRWQVTSEDPRPTLADRQAVYASWRRKLHDRVEENRALSEEPEPEVQVLDDQWSPDALFAESRRLADAG